MLSARFTLGKGTCRLVLLEGCRSMCWNAVVGRRRVVCLNFLVLLSPWDDDIACVATNVNHIAKVTIGVVVVVALLFLLTVGEALVPERPFLIKKATTLVEVFYCVLFFQLDSNYYCWRRCRQVLLDSSMGFCDRGRSRGLLLRVVLPIGLVCLMTGVVECSAGRKDLMAESQRR